MSTIEQHTEQHHPIALIGLAVNAALLAVQKWLCRWDGPRPAKPVAPQA